MATLIAIVGHMHNGNFVAVETSQKFDGNDFVSADAWAQDMINSTDCDTAQFEHSEGDKKLRKVMNDFYSWNAHSELLDDKIMASIDWHTKMEDARNYKYALELADLYDLYV